MENNKALKDFTKLGTEVDVKNALEEIQIRAFNVLTWISENIPRTNESLPILNLLSSTLGYTKIVNPSIDEHISILGLATRSLYELNLTIRSVLENQQSSNSWCSEAITDKIQILEGLLSMDTVTEMTKERKILQTEIDRLLNLREKHNLPAIKTPSSASQKAQQLGLSEEHKNLYKLFSKIVHPSSYLVNDSSKAASIEIRVILQVQAQVYAWDSINRVSQHFNVPTELN